MAAVREIAALADPVGEVIEERTLASGLRKKVRVPLGVTAVVREARPNVSVDCAALTLKSGNAIVLRGRARRTLQRGAGGGRARGGGRAGPEGSVELRRRDRAELADLATADGLVDLVTRARRPEGGAEVGGDRAGDARRGGQLPRLRSRGRRS
jgi:glutamate-5-semialdehyde dehydrogenase